MALFSFRHSVRTFSPKRAKNERAAEHGQTLAHLRYITRPSAARVVHRERVADDAEAARAAEQAAEKRGGRVAERFILALPVEATAEQRVALARAYAEELTQGVAGYVLAIHDARGNDARNPHCHLVAFDAFERTGGRGRPRSVLGMAREGGRAGGGPLGAPPQRADGCLGLRRGVAHHQPFAVRPRHRPGADHPRGRGGPEDGGARRAHGVERPVEAHRRRPHPRAGEPDHPRNQ